MAKLKVRARAVDMLGRQQIAGIPTAIHELFKNAHDAYAEHVEIDYYRRTRVMVLRDDGIGMTRAEVENRWLAIGTESRLGANAEERPWTGPKNLPRRSIMGEKGIGRLAIASIAPVTLLMTRAIRPDGYHNLVVALVQWRLFELPGLDISEIDIPIQEFEAGSLPNGDDINGMVCQIQENLKSLQGQMLPESYSQIWEELHSLHIAPDRMERALNENRPEPLSLGGDGHGTLFVMLPTHSVLDDDIDGGVDKASPLEKNLLGFSNTMNGTIPVIKTSFRDHGLDGEVQERIANRSFFLAEDLKQFDHHFQGTFDEYGQFNGTISIYTSDPISVVFNWPEGKGRLTKCGPFSTECTYVMGLPHESHLEPGVHSYMTSKLDRLGGLYVYRDGVRILPYGDSDFDWLDIEIRRTKSAQDWFFSFRRLFGYVDLSHKFNTSLSEKAGREGFRQNQAYRDFRAILINLFQRLALEFFRPSSPQNEFYWDQKKVFKDAHQALLRQKRKSKERVKEFSQALDQFFKKHEGGIFEKISTDMVTKLEHKLNEISNLSDKAKLAEAIVRFDNEVRDQLREFERSMILNFPRGLPLKGSLEKDWASYQWLFPKLKERLIDDVRTMLARKQSELLETRIDASQRREAALEDLRRERDSVFKDLSSLRQKAYQATDIMKSNLRQKFKEDFAELRPRIDGLLAKFVRESAEKPFELETLHGELEHQIANLKSSITVFLESVRRNMDDFGEDLKEGHTPDDRVGALVQELNRLEEKLTFYQDFANTGMAVGILQHEFEKSTHQFRTAMRDLKPWTGRAPALQDIYTRMRTSFDHLDGYLKLLDPLGRRMNRSKLEITGDAIRTYLWGVFEPALKNNGITLKTTDTFRDFTVKCETAALLAAFVNIFDNAIYWVSLSPLEEKLISLDADESGFLISNNGQGIEDRYHQRIFDFGETTKPGGRGMGLAISRDALERDGFTLELLRYGKDVHPVFRIKINKEDEVEGEDVANSHLE